MRKAGAALQGSLISVVLAAVLATQSVSTQQRAALGASVTTFYDSDAVVMEGMPIADPEQQGLHSTADNDSAVSTGTGAAIEQIGGDPF